MQPLDASVLTGIVNGGADRERERTLTHGLGNAGSCSPQTCPDWTFAIVITSGGTSQSMLVSMFPADQSGQGQVDQKEFNLVKKVVSAKSSNSISSYLPKLLMSTRPTRVPLTHRSAMAVSYTHLTLPTRLSV